MGRSIIKQPNGKFAIWSMGKNDFEILDATEDEIRAIFLEEAVQKALVYINNDLARARDRGTSSLVDRTWDEAIERIREVHGEKIAQDRANYMGDPQNPAEEV